MELILVLALIVMTGVHCDYYNIWLGTTYTSGWSWYNGGQLLSETYAKWASGEPGESVTGHVYLSQVDDFAYVVETGSPAYTYYMCEAVPSNDTCPENFGLVLERCYRLGWTSTGSDWSDTRTLCNDLGAELLEIETETEYKFIYSWLKSLVPTTTAARETTTSTLTPASGSTSRTSGTDCAPSFSTVLTSSPTPDGYTYVTCRILTTTAPPSGPDVDESASSGGLAGTPTPAPVGGGAAPGDGFDPSTHPDMAIVPASIGLTAMVALALSMIGVVALDVGALRRDTRRLIRNVRHACRKVKSGRSGPGPIFNKISAGQVHPKRSDRLADKA